MSPVKALSLAVALAAASPAWAGLVYSGTGSYNLGSSSAPGSTAATSSACGFLGNGQDSLTFTGSGVNNIGIHAYSCDIDSANFGSRASGENTYYAQGIASVTGSFSFSDAGTFSFYVNPGEVGAFGSTAFAAGEFQKSSLTIKLVIDGTVYVDDAWSAEIGTGGSATTSHTSDGSLAVGWTSTSGAGYYNYGLAGGGFGIDLDAGEHDISYVMTSSAAGNILSTGICSAALYGDKGVEGATLAEAHTDSVVAGPQPGGEFASYCGAGARSGDPFPANPIARAFDGTLPEPMTAGLTLTGLLAAMAARRRRDKR